MELQQLRYAIAVAETANFTRAAERCRVVQSALSHQIARLERELGARLFERTSRRVRVTPAGEAFLPAARQALDAAERARAEVAAVTGEIRGGLVIGAIPTVTAVDLPGALREFRARHPQVRISLRAGSSYVLVDQVREGELDLAFLGVLPGFQASGVREHDLGSGELVAVVAPDHALAEAETVELRRLAEEVFVDFPSGSGARSQSDEAFDTAGLDREVAFEVSGVDFLARLVRHGLGVGMVPEAFVEELPGLHVLRIDGAPARVERVVWNDARLTPAAKAFLAGLGV